MVTIKYPFFYISPNDCHDFDDKNDAREDYDGDDDDDREETQEST